MKFSLDRFQFKLLLLFFISCVVGVSFAQPVPGPPPSPTPASANLVIEDMFWTPKATGEFPTFDLHVIVTNAGPQPTMSKPIFVKVWHNYMTVQGIAFKPVPPVAQLLANIGAGESRDVVWENLSTAGKSYYIAVVDIPTKPGFPFGREQEKPIETAEKDNVRGIPTP